MYWGVAPWLLFIAAIALRMLLGKSKRIKKIPMYFVIPASLTFVAGAAMAEIIIGEKLANLMVWGADTFGGFFGVPGQPVLVLTGFLLMVLVVVGLSDFKADKMELRVLLILPSLFLAAGGAGLSGEGSQLAEGIGAAGLSAILG
jgi:hypothetical protein